jgi:hypothetical protein
MTWYRRGAPGGEVETELSGILDALDEILDRLGDSATISARSLFNTGFYLGLGFIAAQAAAAFAVLLVFVAVSIIIGASLDP